MWLSATTGDSGEWDKEAGYIRKKLRCVCVLRGGRGGRVVVVVGGGTGTVPPPIVCTRSKICFRK